MPSSSSCATCSGLRRSARMPGVDGRVQRLHPAVEALGEAGHLLDRGHRHARLGDPPAVDAGARRARRRPRPGRGPAPRGRSCRRRRAAPGGPAPAAVRSLIGIACLPSGRRSRRSRGQPGHRRHQELALHGLDALVQPVLVVVGEHRDRALRERPGRCRRRRRPGARCTRSTSAPAARASRTACAPGKAGSSAGWVLTSRPPNASSTAGPTIFMNPAETTRSGRCAAIAAASARSHAARSGWSRSATTKVGEAAPAGVSRPSAGRSAPTATTVAG